MMGSPDAKELNASIMVTNIFNADTGAIQALGFRMLIWTIAAPSCGTHHRRWTCNWPEAASWCFVVFLFENQSFYVALTALELTM